LKLSKHFPWDFETIEQGLTELIHEEVMPIDGDYLIQKRMIKEHDLRLKRAEAGRKGGLKKRIPKNAGGS
jgi:hypothetical protein